MKMSARDTCENRFTWLPLVLGPALAIESMPGSCRGYCQRREGGEHKGADPKTKEQSVQHRVFQLEVLIGKFFPVDALSTGAVELGEVASLNHEIFDHAVEDATAVAAQALFRVRENTIRHISSHAIA
jgi:hypothetical protein